MAAVLFSCTKPTDIISPPIDNTGNKPDTSSYFQLSISGVAVSNDALFALVSMETSGGQPFISNKKLTLSRDQDVYLTEKIKIARGSYKLSKLLLTTASDTALYAVPKAQTAKAAQVSAPLSLAVNIIQSAVTKASVQALAIGDTDAPESYGYTTEDFGYLQFIRLRAHISIRVGTVLYDSLPGKVSIDAVNAAGNHWHKELELAGGLNNISVPEKYTSYQFTLSKWNTTDLKTLSRQQLQPNGVLEFSASRNPKRLVMENTFIETAAGYITDSRTAYTYENNLLSGINYQHKTVEENALRLTSVHKFVYSNNRLDTVRKYDAFNNLMGYTALTYKSSTISNILETYAGQVTGAVASYSETNEAKTIEADYFYANGNTMNYRMVYRNGNKITDQARTSTGGTESAAYSYDHNINPYYQLGYPDLLFSRTSQNNLLLEQRNYGGNIPSVVAYKNEYTYSADGYPEEKIVSYKGYTSGQHLYRVKTQYTYQ